MRTSFRRSKPAELTAQQVACWTELQEAAAGLESPYFRPEFTLDVAAVRKDAEVAVFERGGEPVGFLPFQRTGWAVGRPVGWPLCDFQGAIVSPEVDWDPVEMVRTCGLSVWEFDHLLVEQARFAPHHVARADSPYIDLSGGFDAYVAERRRAGSALMTQVLRKARKAERELGSLRFEAHADDPAVLATLIAWKRAQYQRTDARDVLGYRWVRALIERILARRDPAFRGLLSALYVGDRLAAVHLGMRSRRTLHWWFPAYDRELEEYSPGLLLLVEIARAAPSLGVARIDLGKGMERYKRSLMSGAIPLAEGSVECHALVRRVRAGWHRGRRWLRAVHHGRVPRLTPEAPSE
jgi:CelD/BcsL family acetyltransferase involved in cellulose biosynthesis